MGLLDNASNFVNRGLASAERGTRSLSLKAQIGDLNKRREEFAAQLGASLFEMTHNDAKFRTSCEPVYAAIEDLDRQLASLQEELLSIERQAQAADVSQQTMACPACGNLVAMTDSFCASCGANVADMKKDMRFCSQCGSALDADALFCMVCGAPAAPAQAEVPVVSAVPSEAEPLVVEPPAAEPPVAEPLVVEPPAAEPPVAEPSAAESSSVDLRPTVSPAPVVESAPAVSDDSLNTDVAMPIEDVSQTPVEVKVGLCLQCGFENVPEAKFCRKCGQALKA